MYHVHRFKCVKCNSLYKIEYYRDIVWYCKINFKTNFLRLETKKGNSCLYSFKCHCIYQHLTLLIMLLLKKDIINYRDINLILFFNNGFICFIINIYSNN